MDLTDHHGKSFRALKQALTSQPVMQLPDPTAEFRIHVDSTPCGYGCGAILLQRVKTREEKHPTPPIETIIALDPKPTSDDEWIDKPDNPTNTPVKKKRRTKVITTELPTPKRGPPMNECPLRWEAG